MAIDSAFSREGEWMSFRVKAKKECFQNSTNKHLICSDFRVQATQVAQGPLPFVYVQVLMPRIRLHRLVIH